MTSNISTDFLERMRAVLGNEEKNIALHEPRFDESDKQQVTECLESTFVSTFGPYVNLFENRVSEITGSKHAVAVTNGTAALQVALHLAGVRGGEEVIVPAMSFIATANSVSFLGAIPHFLDVCNANMGLDPIALRAVLTDAKTIDGVLINKSTGRRIAAIVPMHALGHPADIVQIVAIAKEFGVPVVEDAAESLGSYVGDKHTGTFGLLGIISFNGNKIVTTGGGGVILTDDAGLAKQARHLTTTARVPHRWEFQHDALGWNFRMPNLNAALGVSQLNKLPIYLEQKRALAGKYRDAFASSEYFEFINEPAGTRSNYWLCAVRLRKPSKIVTDEVLKISNDAGFQIRPLWNLLPEQELYGLAPSHDIKQARVLRESVLCLPSTPDLVADHR